MRRTFILGAFAVALLIGVALVPARASSIPSLVAAQQVPASGFQNFEAFSVTCATTATAIAPSSGMNFQSVYCENNSATSVFVGGSGVTTSAPCISTTSATCLRSSLSADAARGAPYCLVASGTQAIKCLGGS